VRPTRPRPKPNGAAFRVAAETSFIRFDPV
jgi:hypothetical protein